MVIHLNVLLVYLSTLNERIVPLRHYSFITCNEGFFKKLRDKELEREIREIINRPISIYEKKEWNDIIGQLISHKFVPHFRFK